MTLNKNILIIGLGNIILSDEGAGVKAVEEFQSLYDVPDNVEIIDGGTLGSELIPYFQNREYVIAVDAVITGREPGTAVKFKIDTKNFSPRKTSSHQTSFQDILNLASIMDRTLPANVTVIGIEPEYMKVGLNLSETVEKNLQALVNMIVEELKAAGADPKLK